MEVKMIESRYAGLPAKSEGVSLETMTPDTIEEKRTGVSSHYVSFRTAQAILIVLVASVYEFIFLAFMNPSSLGNIQYAFLSSLVMFLCGSACCWGIYRDSILHGFAIEEDHLVVYTGIYWRKHQFVPIAKIQHVEMETNPIEKRMGIANLTIYTSAVNAK